MGAMVSDPDTYAPGVYEDVEGVQGRQAGRVGQTRGVEERREEGFETGACGGGVAGVDVCVEWLGSLWCGGKLSANAEINAYGLGGLLAWAVSGRTIRSLAGTKSSGLEA